MSILTNTNCSSYISVDHRRDKYCRKGSQTVEKGGATSGYLSSPSIDSRIIPADVRTSKCDWNIKVLPGQRINVTLFDFNLLSSSMTSMDNRDVCQVYAIINEKSVGADVTVCGGEQRQKCVYISETNSVKIQIMNIFDAELVHFLIKYEGKS